MVLYCGGPSHSAEGEEHSPPQPTTTPLPSSPEAVNPVPGGTGFADAIKDLEIRGTLGWQVAERDPRFLQEGGEGRGDKKQSELGRCGGRGRGRQPGGQVPPEAGKGRLESPLNLQGNSFAHLRFVAVRPWHSRLQNPRMKSLCCFQPLLHGSWSQQQQEARPPPPPMTTKSPDSPQVPRWGGNHQTSYPSRNSFQQRPQPSRKPELCAVNCLPGPFRR